MYSQTLQDAQINELNQLLDDEKKSYDLKLESLYNEYRDMSNRIDDFELKSKNLNLELEKYEVSSANINVYNSLKNKTISAPLSYSNKGLKKMIKKINETYNFTLDSNFFFIDKNIVYYELDNNGKAISLKEQELDSKMKKKMDDLQIQTVFFPSSIAQTQNDKNYDLFLYNLTGVNLKFFSLKNEIENFKDSISKENNLLKLKETEINDLNQDYNSSVSTIKAKLNLLEEELRKIEEERVKQEKIEAQAKIASENLQKYKCKTINGTEIYTEPLFIKQFRDGTTLKEARTPGEWDDFIKNKIPAYKYKDFDSKNTAEGLVYNYFAFSDPRELAPIGFHKFNILDYASIENVKIGEYKKVTKECYCENGFRNVYSSCQHCWHWTNDQRKYNVCPKCNNEQEIYKGKEKCSQCNGSNKYMSEECQNCEKENLKVVISNEFKISGEVNKYEYVEDRDICFLDCSIEYNGFLKYQKIGSDYYINIVGKEFCFFLVKNKEQNFPQNATSQIGQLQLMNTLLNVSTFKNGDPIKYIEDKVEWELAERNGIPAYCHYNNDKSNPFFYNKHAINDKRGLLPTDWRMITGHDIIYIETYTRKNFSFLNNTIPFKKPKGYRNETGDFIEYKANSYYDREYEETEFEYMNFNFEGNYYDSEYKINNDFLKQGGYVMCVRRSSNFDEINSDKLVNINSDNPFASGGHGSGSGKGIIGGIGSGGDENDRKLEVIEDSQEQVLVFAEEDAEYPGGYPAMVMFIKNNMVYPPSAIDLGIQGKVTVKFTVEKNGQITNVSVIRGITGCNECDKEAVRVFSKMPNWKPAKSAGKPVRQWLTNQLTFSLE